MAPEWSTACPDWEARIVAGESLIPFAPLFPKEAEAALAVFKSLHIVDLPFVRDPETGVSRPPTFGEVSEQWVFDFVAAIFGAYDANNASRLITEFFLLISKKNTKSTIAAGVMLTALIRNWRHSAELLIIAPTLEVALNSFKPAADMVRADPELMDLLHVKDHKKSILHRVTKAELKVIAADSETASGKKASFVLVEELWAFGGKENAGPMLQEATGGLVSRPEGFVIYLTTHADKAPAGVFKEKLEYFRDIRDGVVVDKRKLGVLYEFPKAMIEAEAYLDPKWFHITNPNIDKSVSREWLLEKLTEALRGDGSSKQVFLAKHLNVEIGTRLRHDRWTVADIWHIGADKTITFESLMERCDVLTLGADGGGKDDLFGATVGGRERKTGKWLTWSHAWALESVLQIRKTIAPELRDFVSDGDLTLVTRLTQITEGFCAIAKAILNEGLFPEEYGVGVDPAGMGAIVDALAGVGIEEPLLRGINTQAWGMASAIYSVEWKINDAEFCHDGSRMMNWCVGNAKTTPAKNLILITKQVAGAAKIDPLISLFLVSKLLERNPQAMPKQKPSLHFI